jgi:hypothetical protein
LKDVSHEISADFFRHTFAAIDEWAPAVAVRACGIADSTARKVVDGTLDVIPKVAGISFPKRARCLGLVR